MQYKRRRERKTNYKKRFALLKSKKTRIVVRKSNKNFRVQFINYKPDGDFILLSSMGSDLKNYGWDGSYSNTPSAYLAGFLAGKKAIKKGINEGILDIGLNSPRKGAKIFAALKGVVDAGVKIPYSEDIIPSDERLHGKHIDESLVSKVEEVKKKIEEEYG